MTGRRDGERGQVAVYAVVLFPLLMLTLALVLAVGSLEDLRTRLRAQLDMAALVATQALDPAGLAAGDPPRLDPVAAEALAREYLARNLAATDALLASSAAEIAASADVVVSKRFRHRSDHRRSEHRTHRKHPHHRAGAYPAARTRRHGPCGNAHD